MERLLRYAKRLSSYLGRFGLVDGLRLFIQVEIGRRVSRSASELTVDVPGLGMPLLLRRQQSDLSTFWQCVVSDQYSLARFPQLERLSAAYERSLSLGQAPLIIDGGANIGLASHTLAAKFPQARLIAIEPDPENLRVLRRNLRSLGDRAIVVAGALWSESACLQISNPEAGSAAFRVELAPRADGSTIRAYTIDELCALAGVSAPFILKLDIEGAQAQLFNKNTAWVEQTHLIMLELDDWQLPWEGTSRPFFATVSRYPFDYLIGGETIFCFRDFAPTSNLEH